MNAVQFRISEALTILPFFTSAAIPGLAIGCFLANLLTGAAVWDIVFGTVATLTGAVLTYALRKFKWLAPVPPILANTLIVPFVLRYTYGMTESWWLLALFVFIGEFVCCGILGMLLLFAINKRPAFILDRQGPAPVKTRRKFLEIFPPYVWICFSILFVKQHYVLDIVAAVVVTEGALQIGRITLIERIGFAIENRFAERRKAK